MPIGLNHNTETIRPNEDSFLEIGSVYGSARSTTPSGYLLCDGSLVSRTTYSRLFSVISTIYGSGDGNTTFALPDLRGAVPRGAGTSNGYTQNVTVTLGTKTNDGVENHSHTFNENSGFGYALGAGSGGNGAFQTYGSFVSTFTAGASVGSMNSGRTAAETRMKNLGMNFFIKF
jgi:microcystin-dependent protein